MMLVPRVLALSCRQALRPTHAVPMGWNQKRHFNRPQQTSYEDPERPGLYYHLVGGATNVELPSYAVSFLEEPPKSVSSPTIVGMLPAASSQGGEDSQEAGLHDFRPNPRFLDVLHDSIKLSLERDVDGTIRAEAQQRGSGWMHIIDYRNPPALNRVGDPDDIIGSVRIEGGKAIASTYERMPSYRICTSDGVTTLSNGLSATLLEKLLETHRREPLKS